MGMLIVIDGPAASGTGTLALKMANHFGFELRDSGLVYRAITSLFLETGRHPVLLARNLNRTDLLRANVRSEQVSRETPEIAKIPAVRTFVNEFLKKLIDESEGSVIDGRDMAFVFPEAQVKIFLTAAVEVRAKRRYKQARERGEDVELESVLNDLLDRDRRDRERKSSPFRKHPEAYEIDTTYLNANEVFDAALEIFARCMCRH